MKIESEITPEVYAALEVLRNAGFAVAAFCPTELQDVPAKYVDNAMVEAGWAAIDVLKEV